MSEYVSQQQKKDLKLRAHKLLNAIRLDTKLPLDIRFTGFLSKKAKNIIKKNDEFNLDFDIRGKFKKIDFQDNLTSMSADDVYQTLIESIKNNLQGQESTKNKKKIISIINNESKINYYYDIDVFKREKDGQFNKLLKNTINNKLEWDKEKINESYWSTKNKN